MRIGAPSLKALGGASGVPRVPRIPRVPEGRPQLRKGARGVACLSGGVRIHTHFNSLIHSVLVWIPPEADPEARISASGDYLDTKGNTSWSVGRPGQERHSIKCYQVSPSGGIWSSGPPGSVGARAEHASQQCHPRDKGARVFIPQFPPA